MKIGNAMSALKQIYIETAPFIYYVENRVGFVDKVEAVLFSAKQNSLPIVTSVVTLTELLNKPIEASDSKLVKAYLDLLLHSQGLSALPVNAAIAEQAAHLRANYQLRTPDALHLATAIESACDAFLTNDKNLRKVTEIQVPVLDELELDTTA